MNDKCDSVGFNQLTRNGEHAMGNLQIGFVIGYGRVANVADTLVVSLVETDDNV